MLNMELKAELKILNGKIVIVIYEQWIVFELL